MAISYLHIISTYHIYISVFYVELISTCRVGEGGGGGGGGQGGTLMG